MHCHSDECLKCSDSKRKDSHLRYNKEKIQKAEEKLTNERNNKPVINISICIGEYMHLPY